ncbi:hypothetical protein E2C01_076362 [Portunus trituberculatus]|uniref:Uncharacterized protein n=1 Tax=Portunus trituberculatus TaxID=210409 RepID=A0A5B7I8J3_PORTR|nr:hypothetical protein [Portunus trituberculatus]
MEVGSVPRHGRHIVGRRLVKHRVERHSQRAARITKTQIQKGLDRLHGAAAAVTQTNPGLINTTAVARLVRSPAGFVLLWRVEGGGRVDCLWDVCWGRHYSHSWNRKMRDEETVLRREEEEGEK